MTDRSSVNLAISEIGAAYANRPSLISFLSFLDQPSRFLADDAINFHLSATMVSISAEERRFAARQIDDFLYSTFVRRLNAVGNRDNLVDSLLHANADLASEIANAPTDILELFFQCIAAGVLHAQLSAVIFKPERDMLSRIMMPEAMNVAFSEANLLYANLASYGDAVSVFTNLMRHGLEDEGRRAVLIEFGKATALAFLSSLSNIWGLVFQFRAMAGSAIAPPDGKMMDITHFASLRKLWERKCQARLNS
jgi:hypothetical protein